MSEIVPTPLSNDEDMPWPWGPVEEYLAEYEQYFIGALEDEPVLPEGLTEEDLQLIEYSIGFLDFNEEHYLMGDTKAHALYDTLREVQDLPETKQHSD
jgi:hypothetical protein